MNQNRPNNCCYDVGFRGRRGGQVTQQFVSCEFGFGAVFE